MAIKSYYPTGPIEHFLRQVSDLQYFRRKKKDQFAELADREVEVLIFIAEGVKNPAIAKELDISRTTVQNHRAQIRAKLDIDNQTDFVKYVLAFELIQL